MISAFRRAASHKEKLAEVYETEIGDPKKAIESYELAASWYVCTYALFNGEVMLKTLTKHTSRYENDGAEA